MNTRIDLPENIKFRAFYLGKVEQFSENKNEAYCYIIPTGVVQDVSIQVVRIIGGLEEKATFKIEPFFGVFEFHEGLLKPEK